MNPEGDLPTQTTPSNPLKPPIVVAVVLIIAIFAATGGYLLGRKTSLSSTPTEAAIEGETANWKTYTRDGEFQYSYPSTWIINEVVPPDGSSNIGDPSGKYPHGYLTVYRQFSTIDCALEQRMINEGYFQSQSREHAGVIGGIPAKVFEGMTITDEGSYVDRKIILVFHVSKSACYSLDYSASNGYQKQILDRIVSTFSFLN
jgi:hypothetical protein